MFERISTIVVIALGSLAVAAPAYAGGPIERVPEPLTMSMVAAGAVGAFAVRKLLRRK